VLTSQSSIQSQLSEKDDYRIATLLMTGIYHSHFDFPTLMVLLAG
jgi:hypothetical protein